MNSGYSEKLEVGELYRLWVGPLFVDVSPATAVTTGQSLWPLVAPQCHTIRKSIKLITAHW